MGFFHDLSAKISNGKELYVALQTVRDWYIEKFELNSVRHYLQLIAIVVKYDLSIVEDFVWKTEKLLTRVFISVSIIDVAQQDGYMINTKISNIRCTKSQNLNHSRLILHLPLPNLLKPGVK